MTDFKVGDKVKYVGGRSASVSHDWIGIECVVTADRGNFVYAEITKGIPGSKTHKEGFEIWPYKENLELIVEEEPFTYEDIQKGDLIRRTFIRKDGSKVIWEGTAFGKNHDKTTWMTKGGYTLAQHSDEDFPDVTLELLERPEPPHWTEGKPVGSMFLYGKGEDKALWKKTTETGWTRTFLTNNNAHCFNLSEVKRIITERQEWLK